MIVFELTDDIVGKPAPFDGIIYYDDSGTNFTNIAKGQLATTQFVGRPFCPCPNVLAGFKAPVAGTLNGTTDVQVGTTVASSGSFCVLLSTGPGGDPGGDPGGSSGPSSGSGTDYSRSCYNPSAYNGAANYTYGNQTNTCDNWYLGLSGSGQVFENVTWSTVNPSLTCSTFGGPETYCSRHVLSAEYNQTLPNGTSCPGGCECCKADGSCGECKGDHICEEYNEGFKTCTSCQNKFNGNQSLINTCLAGAGPGFTTADGKNYDNSCGVGGPNNKIQILLESLS